MKASEYAAAILALVAEHGDLEVVKSDDHPHKSQPAPLPIIERRFMGDDTWLWRDFNPIEKRGEKVIRV